MTNGNKQPSRKATAPFVVVLAVSLISAGAIAYGAVSSTWSGVNAADVQEQSSSAASAASSSSASSASSASAASDASSVSSSSGESSASSAAGSVLGEYTVSSQSRDDDRAKNLSNAVSLLDGTVIKPGETLSLNKVLGDLESASGYYVASESADGHSGAARGGGACQVASALYVAAVRADIDIIERHAHDEACDYAPAGFDAEIGLAAKDLKLKNNLGSPITISATAQGQVVHVQVLGTARDDAKTFDVTAAIVQENADGSYVVETNKVEYERGLLKASEKLSVDLYRANATGFITQQGAVSATK